MTQSAKPAFADILAAACRRKVKEDVFQEGYAHVLQVVATPGDFLVHGLKVHAPAGVYSPHETSSTRFLMDHFFALGLDKAGGRFLEIGSGAGAISMLAARHGWEVTATDIDPVAVRATADNARANGLKLRSMQSDLLGALEADEKFDVILFNQPFYHPSRPIEESERTLTDSSGQLYPRFMEQARKHLAPGGRVVIAFANFSNTDILHQPGWRLELRAFDFEAGADGIRSLFWAFPV